jgi:hypothetical protein
MGYSFQPFESVTHARGLNDVVVLKHSFGLALGYAHSLPRGSGCVLRHYEDLRKQLNCAMHPLPPLVASVACRVGCERYSKLAENDACESLVFLLTASDPAKTTAVLAIQGPSAAGSAHKLGATGLTGRGR